MARRGARNRGRIWWLGGALALVGFLGLGVALYGPAGPPPSRPLGAGLPPAQVPRPGTPAAVEPDPGQASRRAEIAAEEARLAALRVARAQLEQEVAALRQQAEDRRRDLPGRKVMPDSLAAGPTLPAAPSSSGGPSLTVPAVTPPAPPLASPPGPPPAAEAPRGVRVFVHHRANSNPANAAAEDVAQSLRGAGFDVSGVRPAPFVPSTPVVRYFHEEDQAAAARLAGRLGRGWAIQDFRAFVPQPPPQTLEVWLPGS